MNEMGDVPSDSSRLIQLSLQKIAVTTRDDNCGFMHSFVALFCAGLVHDKSNEYGHGMMRRD